MKNQRECMWVIEGRDGVDPERLKPLGLYCSCGGSKNDKMTYSVWCNHIIYELSQKQFDNIESWLRKIKLEKLNESN